jgi:hypothetical protein
MAALRQHARQRKPLRSDGRFGSASAARGSGHPGQCVGGPETTDPSVAERAGR